MRLGKKTSDVTCTTFSPASGWLSRSFFRNRFAVFQYYRHIHKTLPVTNRPEIVLIIDAGGGTFNSCIIRTTQQGLLARGGTTGLPLGLQAEACGGSYIDKELLKRILAKSQATGIRWKEDPIKRAELPRVLHFFEWRTLRFSFPRGSLRFLTFDFAVDFSNLSIGLAFPKSELHPELEIHQQLTGEDPKSVVREMWRRHYGRIICATVNEAQQK